MNRTVYFFCRKCFKTHKVDIFYDFNFISYDKRVKHDFNVYLTFDCDCGNKAEEIDPLMLDFIVRLNKLDFYTEFCCEGHSSDNNNMDSGTYIKFLSSDEKYSDGIRVMDKKNERYLKKFLRENVKFPLKYSINEYDKTVCIEMDYTEKLQNLIDNFGFNLIKEECLDEINKLITKLEKKKGKNKNL